MFVIRERIYAHPVYRVTTVKETLACREGYLVNTLAKGGWVMVTRYVENGSKRTKYTRCIIVPYVRSTLMINKHGNIRVSVL